MKESDHMPQAPADDIFWMTRALALASRAVGEGEVPVGAVLVMDGKEIGTGYNAPITGCDPTGHAEIRALRDGAGRLGNYRLPGATLYVTLEPCTMCVGAIVHARVSRLVFGAREPKAGAVVSMRRTLDEPGLNWRVDVAGGILAEQCGELLSDFFASRRAAFRKRKESLSGKQD